MIKVQIIKDMGARGGRSFIIDECGRVPEDGEWCPFDTCMVKETGVVREVVAELVGYGLVEGFELFV